MACSRMPKWKLRPAGVAGREIARAVEGQQRVGRGGQVGRAAQQPGDPLGDLVEHLARRNAAGNSLGVGGKRGDARRPSRRAARRCASARIARPARDTAGWYGRTSSLPGRRRACRRGADAFAEMGVHLVGHQELCVLRPAVDGLGQADFFFAQRLAVGCRACSACAARPRR